MTPELDIILGLLARNLELCQLEDHEPSSLAMPVWGFELEEQRNDADSNFRLGYEIGYTDALGAAADEIRRLKDALSTEG